MCPNVENESMSCLQQSTVMHARHGRLFCNCWDIVTRDAMLQVQLLVKLSETQAKGCRLHVATCTAPCRHKTGWYEPCSYVTWLSWSGYSCSVSKPNFGSDVQPALEYIHFRVWNRRASGFNCLCLYSEYRQCRWEVYRLPCSQSCDQQDFSSITKLVSCQDFGASWPRNLTNRWRRQKFKTAFGSSTPQSLARVFLGSDHAKCRHRFSCHFAESILMHKGAQVLRHAKALSVYGLSTCQG